MMILQKLQHKILLSIVVLNLISTWLHYTHNAIFLNDYPGPVWFTPQMIIITVAVMSAIGLLGTGSVKSESVRHDYSEFSPHIE